MRRPRLGITSLLALATPLTLSACVIPVDDAAQPLDETNIPDDVFPTTVPTTTSEPEPEQNNITFDLSLYWQFDDGSGANRLVLVERPLETPPTPDEAIEALILGPTEEESAEFADLGLFSRQTSEVLAPVVSEPNENGVVRVMVSSEFGLRENDLAKVPVAEELVCTLTSIDGILGVVVEDEEGEIPLPDKSTATIVGAAARSSYNCDPEPIETAEAGDSTDDDSTDPGTDEGSA